TGANMEKRSRWKRLYHYLRDPHLVARFQRFCGVRGAFYVAGGPTGSGKEAARAHSHNNGACHRHSAGGGESGSPAETLGAGEGERATPGARRRITEGNAAKEGENNPQNGAVVSAAAAAGGEAVAAGRNGRSSGAAPELSAGAEEREAAGSSALKPLRRNSLTGDAGQEFHIENRFLYYLFTFGTELGNEMFYITFFPFVTWNLDAFVSRRLIMVWVWVMYLGQCTKDVIRWARPASPPVVKVEVFYNSEYSMPSTHAMSGTAIPFSLFFMTYGRWECEDALKILFFSPPQYPFSLGFSLALCWCLLVCVSRIYMGMHSVLV
ncbi:hypothetical protein L3Q82_026225, partial [Scortum barcoo]